MRLAACVQVLAEKPDVPNVVAALTQQLESEVKDIEQAAANGLLSMNADDRQQVRIYYTALWLWNRLEQNRWQKAKLALRQRSRRQNSIDVDHIVAWDLWQSKLEMLQAQARTNAVVPDQVAVDELGPKVNELGNCMLLEKNFNISKSNRPLREFLENVHEFKEGTCTLEDWATALDLKMPQVDSATAPIEVLRNLFTERTQKIRSDLEQFVRGTKARIDLQPT